MRISQSLKRAQALFVMPGIGKTHAIEDDGAVDSRLREAIKAAHAAFCQVYYAKPETVINVKAIDGKDIAAALVRHLQSGDGLLAQALRGTVNQA